MVLCHRKQKVVSSIFCSNATEKVFFPISVEKGKREKKILFFSSFGLKRHVELDHVKSFFPMAS